MYQATEPTAAKVAEAKATRESRRVFKKRFIRVKQVYFDHFQGTLAAEEGADVEDAKRTRYGGLRISAYEDTTI